VTLNLQASARPIPLQSERTGASEKRRLSILVLAVPALALSACGSGSSSVGGATASPSIAAPTASAPTTSSPAQPRTAAAAAAKIKASVPSVTKLVTINENNDPNDLLGRPNGYTAAVVIYNQGGSCSGDMGVDCGATVEQWPSEADANARKDYIQSILKNAPALGTEWDIASGPILVRVSGKLKPSVEAAYRKAFLGR
jgi:hypothetical protein